MITLLLADDHQIVRQGLHLLLQAEPGMKIVGETGDGLQAVQLIEQLKPDILVVDIMMPGLNGMEVIRRVRQCSPLTRVVILSMYDSEAYVVEAFKAGASAYVLKKSNSEDLLQAIRQAATGGHYLSPAMSEQSIETYQKLASESPADPYKTLTRREREVLHLAAEGLGTIEIARRLTLSTRTVEVYRYNLLHKLKLKNQSELVRYALKRGLLTLDE